MRKLSIIIGICFILILNVKGQKINTSKLVWAGIDFSKCKLIGPDFNDLNKIKSYYMQSAFQNVIINEPGKFKIRQRFGVKEYIIDTSVVAQSNANIDLATIQNDNNYTLTLESILEIVGTYDKINYDCLHLVFIVESLNKDKAETAVWITLFDPVAHTVVATKRFYGSAGGFGFRNFWVNSFEEIINQGPKLLRLAEKGKL